MNFEKALGLDKSTSESKDPVFILAKKLHKKISSKRKSTKALSVTKFTREIRSLVRKNGEQEVEAVIDWFIENYGQEGVPDIFSAEGFNTFYDTLYKKSQSNSKPTEISELSAKIANWAKKSYAWPAGTDRELPIFVQRSHDSYIAFRAEWKILGEKLVDHTGPLLPLEDQRFRLHRYLTTRLSAPRAFTEYWVEYIGGRLQEWEGWNGSLLQHVWHLNHDWFKKEMYGWVFEYCNDSSKLDDLLSLL